VSVLPASYFQGRRTEEKHRSDQVLGPPRPWSTLPRSRKRRLSPSRYIPAPHPRRVLGQAARSTPCSLVWAQRSALRSRRGA